MPEKKKKIASSAYATTRTTQHVARLAWIFIIVSTILTALIVYFTSIKTTVTITRATYPVQATFVTTVTTNPEDDTSIQGTFELKTIEYTYTDSELGNTTEIPGFAEGDITITNSWAQNQPLQATTRFLSSGGVLFRSTERIDVPSGGAATIHVVADQKGASGNIPAGTRFTIPGLWQGLQEQIYGTNEQVFTGGLKKIAVISEDNIAAAQEHALTGLDEQAASEMKGNETDIESYVLRSELLLSQASASAGTEADSLSYSTRGRYIALHIPSENLYTMLYTKLGLILTDDEEVTEINLDALHITVESIASSSESAQIRIHATGIARLKDTASIFSSVSLSNKTPADLNTIAENDQGIESISASLSPFWAHKTPINGNRMQIVIH
ncbi:MAG: baseplate J/gp47 family protein [Patescibacteria group bacterium]|jgi:hypothetical protein